MMERAEQMAVARRELHLALHAVRARSVSHEEAIIELAMSRLDDGFDVFGDRGWHKTPYELDQDTDEELADAAVYQVMRRHRQRHPG